jgi:two-component system, cell cycle response regulator DivK
VPPKRVLLVEDNYDNREIYREILVFDGYEVLEAVNGREGVEKARQKCPNLVLMDLAMPVMTGWEAIAEFKADHALRDIPVLALSAHVLFEGDSERVRASGFAGYLTKPMEPKKVLAKVREIIGPPHH